jgi:glycosyltransferase involved in cell wall biosynthesis
MTRVVLVHERFTEMGGSEKVVAQLARIWPDSRLFAPIADPDVLQPDLAALPLTVSRLQHVYRSGSRYSHLLPLLPLAMARADLSDADLVVVSHHAFANRVRPPAGVPVLSYVHSPARWLWDCDLRRLELGKGPGRVALSAFARSQLSSDQRAAARVTQLVANSTTVSRRIAQWWGLESEIVHPPVDTGFYTPTDSVQREDFFLLAGRLVPYKRPQVAVAAATAAGVPLVVAGQGRVLEACRAVAGPNVRFVGEVSDLELRDLFRRCRGLVFPGVEDFGMVPVEAQSCGAPVVGIDEGGICDTVIHGVTGEMVPFDADPDRQARSLAASLRDFDTSRFDPQVIRRHAERFGRGRFRLRMKAIATELMDRP